MNFIIPSRATIKDTIKDYYLLLCNFYYCSICHFLSGETIRVCLSSNTVNRAESPSANCRNYPVIHGLTAGIHSADYIHYDGAQLKLADSDLGSEQPFSSSSHYQWKDGKQEQMLFILPTRVTLTTITLQQVAKVSVPASTSTLRECQ